jgi:hypothetical protein
VATQLYDPSCQRRQERRGERCRPSNTHVDWKIAIGHAYCRPSWGEKLAEIPLQSTLKLNEDVRVEMVWATPHLVVIRIGDAEEKAIQIPWVASRVEVTGSTGEVKLDPLVLGTMTP